MFIRPRRLRATPALRGLIRETRVAAEQLILPVFVAEGLSAPREISSMPGVFQQSLDSVRELANQAAEAGLGGIMLFGVPSHKDAEGSSAWAHHGILNRAISAVRDEIGDTVTVMADTCLDEFTDHGHCGVLDNHGRVDNDATLSRYAAMAVSQAEAGAAVVSPSGMMDGQVLAIREGLDTNGFSDIAILAYSAKYASAFFGPFRDAVGSSLVGDRRTYQQDPANIREGIFEAELDEAQGADILMVKPAGYYLDVLAAVAANSSIPVAAYQVSGEYSMICAAAANGWIDREAAFVESITSIIRAGASAVLTYAALDLYPPH